MHVLKKLFQKKKRWWMKKSDSVQRRELKMNGVGDPAQVLFLDSEVVFVSFCGIREAHSAFNFSFDIQFLKWEMCT